VFLQVFALQSDDKTLMQVNQSFAYGSARRFMERAGVISDFVACKV
jgi:hypothetical protein